MGLYSEGLIIRKIFASEIWGAYFWEGLIFSFFWGGGAYYWNFTVYSDHFLKNINNRHPSVRLTMDSILIVCLAGAPASVAEEADAGMTVFVTETASVLCLWSVEAVALFSADPSLRGGLCQLLLT